MHIPAGPGLYITRFDFFRALIGDDDTVFEIRFTAICSLQTTPPIWGATKLNSISFHHAAEYRLCGVVLSLLALCYQMLAIL